MKRHKALQSLSQEHHHALILALLIKIGSPDYKGLPKTIEDKKNYTLKFFKEKLIPHFNKEEDILFPLSKKKNPEIENLVNILIKQHKEIYSLIDKLKISSRPEYELDELGKLLEGHIRKEERELFKLIQEALTENELEQLEIDLGETSPGCKI
jgi:iron-sulfur cluster repair protein YtfE (RIC family)